MTVPYGDLSHVQTVSAIGVTAASRVFLAVAPHSDADENSPELLDLLSISGAAGTDQITITLTFATPTGGPIKLYWRA